MSAVELTRELIVDAVQGMVSRHLDENDQSIRDLLREAIRDTLRQRIDATVEAVVEEEVRKMCAAGLPTRSGDTEPLSRLIRQKLGTVTTWRNPVTGELQDDTFVVAALTRQVAAQITEDADGIRTELVKAVYSIGSDVLMERAVAYLKAQQIKQEQKRAKRKSGGAS